MFCGIVNSSAGIGGGIGGAKTNTNGGYDDRARISVVGHHPSIGSHSQGSSNCTFRYVNIIVSGYFFKTQEETLMRFSNSLLGDVKQRNKYYDKKRKAHVFKNRCRQSFESILYFYQSNGQLIQPVNVGQGKFMDEVKFFRLPIHDAMKSANFDCGVDTGVQSLNNIPRKLQKLMENKKSLGFKLLATFDTTVTFTYVTTQLIKTTPEFHKPQNQKMHHIMFLIELGCIIWFTVLYILRMITTKNIRLYVLQFMNMIEIIVIVSFVVDIIIHETQPLRRVTNQSGYVIPLAAVITIAGFLRLFNIARYSELLYCLGIALKRSLADLVQVLFVILLLTFLFATLAYYSEEDEDMDTFLSIFDALYWGTITISTVGYGDIAPQTTGGKFVGATLALLGLPLIAIPMPLIMSKFDNYYQNVKRKRRTNEMREKLIDEMTNPDYESVSDESEQEKLEKRLQLSWMELAVEAFDYRSDSDASRHSPGPRSRKSAAGGPQPLACYSACYGVGTGTAPLARDYSMQGLIHTATPAFKHQLPIRSNSSPSF